MLKSEIAELFNISKKYSFYNLKKSGCHKAKEINGLLNQLNNKMIKYPLLEKALNE